MNIASLYGWMIVAAFVFFAVCLGMVSEKTEAYLKSQDKKTRRPGH